MAGKTFSTGLLTDAIWQDSSNNIGIGGAASGSHKFQVTGATNLTGVLTLGSTISNGTYTYTLPSATGTLALASQIPSLAGYVPTSRVLTINGVSYNLTADASWTIAAGVTSFNTRTGAISLTSGDVTGALGYTPYNSTNPSGYITSSGTAASANALSGITSSINAAVQSATISSIIAQDTNGSLYRYNLSALQGFGVLTTGNYSSYAVPIGGGVNLGGSIGFNDQRIYLRTNGDNNHYIWNAGDDWEELVGYYGWRVYQAQFGVTIATFATDSATVAARIDIGPDSGNNHGVGIHYGSSGYGRIRFYNDGTNHQTIHSFGSTWASSLADSRGAININGQLGVTFGPWNVPDGYIATNGSAWFRYDVTAYSDARVKENVTQIENAIDKINSIRGVTFTRNDVKDKSKRYAGVIAQEVLGVLPEVVSKDEKGMYSVSYGNMGGLFIEGFKEHDQVIKAQGEQLKAQAEEIKELKRIINGFTN